MAAGRSVQLVARAVATLRGLLLGPGRERGMTLADLDECSQLVVAAHGLEGKAGARLARDVSQLLSAAYTRGCEDNARLVVGAQKVSGPAASSDDGTRL